MTDTVIIERMGQLGEGVCEIDDKDVFVAYALPGEELYIERDGARGSIAAIVRPSPERIEPFCQYFGVCGGCALQHWSETAYRDWKRQLVSTALSFEQLAPTVEDRRDAHGLGRRRAKFHLRASADGMQAGYMQPRTHRLIDIEACPILEPALRDAAKIARAVGKPLRKLRKPLSVQFTATNTGLDVDVTGAGKIDFDTRMALTDLANAYDLARLSIHGDIVLERRAPLLRYGKVDVAIPPGGFTQATALGEETLSTLVLEMAGGAGKIADLFCGSGPFTLRLAASKPVHAIDSDAASMLALRRGANSVQKLKHLSFETRDLFRRPLLPQELKSFDTIVIDPPRAGAEAQMRELAASAVSTIISVSCNVASFARDAGILARGGYTLERVVPVDQFKWSPHLEMVGLFRR